MSHRRKEQKIRNIAKLYLLSIAHNSYSFINPKSTNIRSFQSAVELAYLTLDAPLQKIINNEFFYQDYPGWWELLYKKNEYLKLKNTAVNKFLEVFYEL